ncbi:MAG: hypothetical protein EOP84_04300 [Verrucomicrobiaceae bacterium]|nr:MAG: hypothetical protein EOP84_04300 [Verrucomicrobiaceae bacterium]
MQTAGIENLLRQTIGLDADTMGRTAVVHAIRTRMAQCGLSDISEYEELLREQSHEVQELVEEVVVPETWFFRDPETFAALVRLVLNEWLPTHPEGILRLLSLPCSTGEEPYSIAMALLEARLPPERFTVDAADISDRALRVARQANYGRNSFRGRDLEYRKHYFSPVAERYELVQAVRKQVHFQQANLLDLGPKMRSGFYHVIFCRNTLIYFDRSAQRQAVGVLSQLLAPEGVLFVGHAEAFLVASGGFESDGQQMSAAFRKARYRREIPPAPASRFITARRKPRLQLTPKQLVRPEPAAATPERTIEAGTNLEMAAYFANRGQLAEAAVICEDHLRVNGPSAAAYYLLGLVRDLQGNSDEAAEYYRKAIYLDPAHTDALLHFAFLEEKVGNIAAARRLRERASRVEVSQNDEQ